jgi:uncharacterized protein YecE (DUF72 family)
MSHVAVCMVQPSSIRVGTSGWIYAHWRGRFYPQEMRSKDWFAHYARHFDSVEINNSFYRLPSEQAFHAWREQAPPGFVYAVKASRFLTHMKKLADPEEPIERILGRARHLGEKLPRDLLHVMEYRRADWLCDEVFTLMRELNIGLCIHDLLPDHPRVITSNVVYVRFHGAGAKYAGNYTRRHLLQWAKWMNEQVRAARNVYAYFNNDAEAHAVRNAQTLRRLIAAEAQLHHG